MSDHANYRSRRHMSKRAHQLGNVCHYCRQTIPIAHMTRDHIVPRSRGGRTNWRNLVGACGPCNLAKSDNAPTCRCLTCLGALQYHRDVIEAVRWFSPATALRLLIKLDEPFRRDLYRITAPSPTEQGVEPQPNIARTLR